MGSVTLNETTVRNVAYGAVALVVLSRSQWRQRLVSVWRAARLRRWRAPAASREWSPLYGAMHRTG